MSKANYIEPWAKFVIQVKLDINNEKYNEKLILTEQKLLAQRYFKSGLFVNHVLKLFIH